MELAFVRIELERPAQALQRSVPVLAADRLLGALVLLLGGEDAIHLAAVRGRAAGPAQLRDVGGARVEPAEHVVRLRDPREDLGRELGEPGRASADLVGVEDLRQVHERETNLLVARIVGHAEDLEVAGALELLQRFAELQLELAGRRRRTDTGK